MRSWSASRTAINWSRTKSAATLAAVGRDSALYKQTLDKLGAAEASIETVSTAIANKTAEAATTREQLQAFVSALSL
jgi:hypothetical protein